MCRRRRCTRRGSSSSSYRAVRPGHPEICRVETPIGARSRSQPMPQGRFAALLRALQPATGRRPATISWNGLRNDFRAAASPRPSPSQRQPGHEWIAPPAQNSYGPQLGGEARGACRQRRDGTPGFSTLSTDQFRYPAGPTSSTDRPTRDVGVREWPRSQAKFRCLRAGRLGSRPRTDHL